MEFLNINLTKSLSHLLCTNHGPFNQRILLNRILLWFLKAIQENPQNKKILVYSWTACYWKEKRIKGIKTRYKLQSESLCPETSTKNVVQEFYLSSRACIYSMLYDE